jgi:hypothetical protein
VPGLFAFETICFRYYNEVLGRIGKRKTGIMEDWNNGTMEDWNTGRLEYWNNGTEKKRRYLSVNLPYRFMDSASG